MKIVKNKIIPFKGFRAINLFGVLFVRGEIDDKTINHEEIHTAQMKEMLYILFYFWYIIEWFIRLLKYKNAHKSYRNISFELEAHVNEGNFEYLESRDKFNFLSYL